MENNQCILVSTGWSWKRPKPSKIEAKRKTEWNYSLEKINNGTKLATSRVINPCRLSGGERESAHRGRFIIAFRPLLPGIHALLVWMSQLTSFDNWEPRALSKGTTVIVLIGSPLLCWERKMLSNAIAPQRLKIRLAHIGHQRGRLPAFFFFIYRWQWFGALAVSLAPPCTLEQAAISVKAGSGPLGQTRH